MAARTREQLTTRVDAELLADLRQLARDEGRQIQVLIGEAVADLLEKRRSERPRPHVMAAFQATYERYRRLYEKLAE